MKYVVGSADGKGIKISDFGSVLLPQGGMINGIITDAEIMTKYFSEVKSENALSKEPTWLIINNSTIETKVMDVPALGEDKILEFVRREFRQYSDEENDAVYDFNVLNPKAASGGVTILAVGVSKEFLTTYKTALVSAGYDLKGINIGLNCQIKLAGFMPQLKTRTVVLVQLDGRTLSLTLLTNGLYRLQNRSRMVHPENDPEWTDEVASNISTMMQFNKTQKDNEEIAAAYVAGVTPQGMSLLTSGLTNLGIDIKELDLMGSISLTGKAQSKGPFNAGEYLTRAEFRNEDGNAGRALCRCRKGQKTGHAVV
jgi:Tfp pilus assembly PilM family ATPase